MASPNSTFTELVATTARHRKREVADNVTNHNAAWRWMKERGHIKEYSGGYEIIMPLSHAENGTFQWFYGADVLNVQASDVISAAKYDPKQAAIHVTANGRDVRMNRAKEQMIPLVKSRVDVAMATAANNMNTAFYNDGSVSNQIGGLQFLVNDAGTNTVGGINASTYPFWRNKIKELTITGTDTTDFGVVKKELNLLYMSQVRGTDKPDVSIWTHDLYALYEGGLQDNQRYASAKMAEMGFTTLMFKDVPVWFDSDTTNFSTTGETVYMLNTKYLYCKEHPDARWDQEDKRVPTNQDVIVIPMYWMGNICTDGRKFQGVAFDNA